MLCLRGTFGCPEPYFTKRGLATMLVPDGLLKCCVFLGIMREGKFVPRATGFIASFEQEGFRYLHLVTAEHVVSNTIAVIKEDMWCRANLQNGTTAEMKIPPEAWKFYPDEKGHSDVAICPFITVATFPDGTEVSLDHRSIALNGDQSIAATEEIISSKNIGVGEEICVVGLFRSHYGHEKNVPVVRVGNISMLKGDPINTVHGYLEGGYLVEARSIGGLSGSPVFVSMPPSRIIDGSVVPTIGPQFYLLGLIQGHFDIPDLTYDTVADAGAAQGGINSGIGVVVPTAHIIETLLHPDFVAMRTEDIKKQKKDAATPDVSVDDVTSPATDENPDHREDFTHLVSAASKRKPAGGQT